MLESQLERALGLYAKDKGCLYYKFSSPGRRAVPDRLLIAPGGSMMFLEIKAPGKKPSPAQAREIALIVALGGNAGYVDSLEKGRQIIDHLCKISSHSHPKS
jgi:hypothetical protein